MATPRNRRARGMMADSQLLEDETAAETGNIVMESCTGTLADLLDCRIYFRPPRLVDPETGPVMMAVKNRTGRLCRHPVQDSIWIRKG
jgi:hypothetical protein